MVLLVAKTPTITIVSTARVLVQRVPPHLPGALFGHISPRTKNRCETLLTAREGAPIMSAVNNQRRDPLAEIRGAGTSVYAESYWQAGLCSTDDASPCAARSKTSRVAGRGIPTA